MMQHGCTCKHQCLVIQIFNKLLTELTGFSGFYMLKINICYDETREFQIIDPWTDPEKFPGGGDVGVSVAYVRQLYHVNLRSLNWAPEHSPSPISPPLYKIRTWIHACFHYFSILDNFTNNFKNIQFRIILLSELVSCFLGRIIVESFGLPKSRMSLCLSWWRHMEVGAETFDISCPGAFAANMRGTP